MNAFSIDFLLDAVLDCLLTLFKEVRIICSSIMACTLVNASHFSDTVIEKGNRNLLT
jgi:hypothetical protein